MASSSRQDAPPVAVQLTSIVPVRVYNPHGDYFDTEVDLDAPLRAMQLAIEDYFKIKPEVQLLLHNRQQIYAERSLRENGCLLLKGDPFVKLVCAIKRGPVLNLLCEVGQVTYVIACHESCTVWEVKKMLCDEMTRQQQRAEANGGGAASSNAAAGRRVSCGPERLRLLWRYMELNDKATLHYYRVPTNAVFNVMHRKRAVAAPPPPTASANTPRTAPPRAQMQSAQPQPQPAVWWQRPPAAPAGPPASHAPEEYNDAFADLTRRAAPQPDTYTTPTAPPASQPPHQPPSPPPPPPNFAFAQPPAPAPMYAPHAYGGLAPAAQHAPPPAHYDPVTSAETVQLGLRVRALEEQLRGLWQALQEQRQVGEYQRGSLADTHQRILELQEQMEHVLWLQEETARLIPT